jgi:PEP-CTERM motif
MKISQICAFALLLVVGSVMAFADGIKDPKIIIQGVNGGSSPLGCERCQGVGVKFSFQIPNSGKGFLFFTNTSGKNWTSLTLTETGVPASAISCSQSLFLSCTTKTVGASVEIILKGIKGGQNARKGILNGQSFDIGFACVGTSCWTNGGTTMYAHAGTVPEPGTVALMVTGLGAIVSRRKLWKSRRKA